MGRPQVLVVACVAALAGLAASPRLELLGTPRPGVLQVGPRISLLPVGPAELVPDGQRSVALGTWRGGFDSFEGAGAATSISRRVPTVWRMRLADAQDLGRVDVQYEVTDTKGRPGRLASAGATGSEVRVELRPIPPLVVSDDADGIVIEGGLVLHVDLESVRSAGRYEGTLTVTLNQL
jgi:hypothetical protein